MCYMHQPTPKFHFFVSFWDLIMIINIIREETLFLSSSLSSLQFFVYNAGITSSNKKAKMSKMNQFSYDRVLEGTISLGEWLSRLFIALDVLWNKTPLRGYSFTHRR